jgi:hypothetical protein
MDNKVIMIYKGTPGFEAGGLAKIIDKDSRRNSYLVASLDKILLAEGDMNALFRSGSKWIKGDNFEVLSFKKPGKLVTLWRRFKSWIRKLKVKS